jgi:hypothetical protein
MSPSKPGELIEQMLSRFDAQPDGVHVVTGVVLGAAVIAGGLATFVITLLVLVDYLR